MCELYDMWIVCVLVAQSCPTVCGPMDYILPGSSVHGILQARILKWVASSFSRDFPTQGSNLHLLRWQVDSVPLSHQGIPCIGARCCCYSVAKSCPELCDPMDCSTPGFPVLH